jgi:hypothetical protein
VLLKTGFGLVIGFIGLLQLVTASTNNSSRITVYIPLWHAHTKFSQSAVSSPVSCSNGAQRQTFPFLWVSETFPCLRNSQVTKSQQRYFLHSPSRNSRRRPLHTLNWSEITVELNSTTVQSNRYIRTDGQSESLSLCQAPIRGPIRYCFEVGSRLLRQNGSVVYNCSWGLAGAFSGSSTVGLIIFSVSNLTLPQSWGPVPRIYTVLEPDSEAVPPGTGFPFRRLLQLGGLRWNCKIWGFHGRDYEEWCLLRGSHRNHTA